MEFGDSDHPILSNGIGWILSLVPIILILIIAIIKILKASKEMYFKEVISSKHLLHVSIVYSAHINSTKKLSKVKIGIEHINLFLPTTSQRCF